MANEKILGYIYFLRAGQDGPIKIGFTAVLERRLAQLRAGSSIALCILGIYRGTKSGEAAIHRWFNDEWLHNEWFAPTQRLLDFLSHLEADICHEEEWTQILVL